MNTYQDDIIGPTDLKRSYLRRLYARINRGLQDSYEDGFALMSNADVVTSQGRTKLGGFSSVELEMIKEWLEEVSYTVTEMHEPVFFKDLPNLKIYKITWPK